MQDEAVPLERVLASVENASKLRLAYAAKHGQIAFDGDGTGSPFATALVKRLSTPNLEISMLFRMVRDDVLNATGRKQEPYIYGSLPGESLYFVQK